MQRIKNIFGGISNYFVSSSSATPIKKHKMTLYEELPDGARDKLVEKQIVRLEIYLGKMDRQEREEIWQKKQKEEMEHFLVANVNDLLYVMIDFARGGIKMYVGAMKSELIKGLKKSQYLVGEDVDVPFAKLLDFVKGKEDNLYSSIVWKSQDYMRDLWHQLH